VAQSTLFPALAMRHNGRMDSDWKARVRMADAEVKTVLRSLPADLREEAERVIVLLEKRPSAKLVGEGIADDTMGLFEGDNLLAGEAGGELMPPRILLFIDNIWDEAEGDADVFREEVRVTFVHEIGHYLGYEEDDLIERDLE